MGSCFFLEVSECLESLREASGGFMKVSRDFIGISDSSMRFQEVYHGITRVSRLS